MPNDCSFPVICVIFTVCALTQYGAEVVFCVEKVILVAVSLHSHFSLFSDYVFC